jgi:hypothetical protein
MIPDLNYSQIIKAGMSTTSDSGISFLTNSPVDFTVDTKNDPLEVSVFQRNAAGQPDFFVLKKTVDAFSGRIVTKTVSIGNPSPFLKVYLDEPNVIEVMDIYDSDGNRWHETDYLAQDLVPVNYENIYKNDNTLSVYRDTSPFLLRYLRTAKRFVTGVGADNTTFLEFGSGTSIKEDELIVPNAFTVSKPTTFRAENIAYDIASNVAQSVAENNANIITETIEIIKKEPIDEGYGNILVTTQSNDPINIQQSSVLSITEDNNVLINGDFLPKSDDSFNLGSSELKWKEIFVGPGTVNLYGPSLTNFATISSDDNAIAYTESGFATPFINIGPQISPEIGALGGWRLFTDSSNINNLFATLFKSKILNYKSSIIFSHTISFF